MRLPALRPGPPRRGCGWAGRARPRPRWPADFRRGPRSRKERRLRAAALADVRAIAGAALAILALLVLASAQLWWPESRAIGWWSTLAAVLLAAAALELLRRSLETDPDSPHLRELTERLAP